MGEGGRETQKVKEREWVNRRDWEREIKSEKTFKKKIFFMNWKECKRVTEQEDSTKKAVYPQPIHARLGSVFLYSIFSNISSIFLFIKFT